MKLTKKELASIAYTLFNNIDQAEQFDVSSLFYHCDNKFLISLCKDLKSKVQYNIQREKESLFHIESNVSEDEEYLNELFSIIDKL